MMTSRELVRQTLEFAGPTRIPRQLWSLPWAAENYPEELKRIQTDFPADITGAPAFLKKNPATLGDPHKPGRFVDEWGCVFENKESGYIGEVKEPVFEDWKDAGKLRFPLERLTVDVPKVNDFCASTDLFVTGGTCPRPFERLQFIRKTENLYMDLVEQPPEFLSLLKELHEFYMEELKIWVNTDVDAVNFMDDWGAQRSLLISPQMWRELFKPLYKDYIDLAHQHGKYVFMHSDGFILDIIPDLIELGLDALNSQIFCMGLDNLQQFKGQLTFWGEIDRQHLLPYGTETDIVNAVRSAKNALYSNGGVIAQCEFGPGAKPENVYKVFETWDQC